MSNLQEFIQQTYQKEIVLHFSRIFDWKTVVKQPHQPWPL